MKIIAPAMILIVLNAYPVSIAVRSALVSADEALESGFHQAAVHHLRQVVAREPWRAGLWEEIGFEEMKAARFPHAVDAFLRAERAGLLSYQGYYQLGEALYQQSDMAAAEVVWRRLLLEKYETPTELRTQVFTRLTELQRSQGNLRAAVQTLETWNAAEPENAQVLFSLGLHLSVLAPEEALPYLIQASNLDSTYTPTVQVIRRGIALAGESEDPGFGWVMIGRALGSVGQWDLAAAAFQQAVDVSPQYAEAWAFLGEARNQIGETGKADLDRALKLDPDSVLVRALLALYYRQEGAYDLALSNLQAVAEREPKEPIWQVELGFTWAEKGDLPVALEHFQNAVHLAPGLSIYWQYLAQFCISYNVDVQAVGLPAARQAVVLAPDDSGALDAMGWTMVSLQDYDSAERFLQQAVQKDPSHAPAVLHLGQLYLQLGDLERARPYLRQAALLDDDGPIGKVAKRLLLNYYGEGK